MIQFRVAELTPKRLLEKVFQEIVNSSDKNVYYSMKILQDIY